MMKWFLHYIVSILIKIGKASTKMLGEQVQCLVCRVLMARNYLKESQGSMKMGRRWLRRRTKAKFTWYWGMPEAKAAGKVQGIRKTCLRMVVLELEGGTGNKKCVIFGGQFKNGVEIIRGVTSVEVMGKTGT